MKFSGSGLIESAMKNLLDTLVPYVTKLQLWGTLSDKEQQAVLALPHRVAELSAGKQVARQGEKASHVCLLLEGFAFRYKVLANSARSIGAIHISGDVLDLQNAIFRTVDYSVQTLTRCKIAMIDREAMLSLAFTVPNVGRLMWFDSFVSASIFHEWIANVGRRDASARLAHLLCEFGLRIEAIGLGNRGNFELPMTQAQLADATGMTQVHVNRMLRDLNERGLITRGQKSVRITDWPGLAAESGFNETYLHLHDKALVAR